MTRPLLGHQQLVANWDPATDHIEMVGMVPGPAGIATLGLDALTIDIDVANPASVAFISIPEVSTANSISQLRDLLGRLIGSDSADAVLEMSRSHDSGRVVVGGGATTLPGPRERARPEVAALAISLTQAGTPGLKPAERAVAVLEAVALAGQVGLIDSMTWLTSDVGSAIEDLEGAGPNELRQVDAELAEKITAICTDAARYISSPAEASRVVAFAESLSSATAEPDVREGVQRDGRTLEQAEISPDSLTVVCGSPELELRHAEADEFEARIPGWADRASGWWVRAFSVDGQTPIAMAPMLPDGIDAVASLLIPQAHQVQLQIDVVEDPLEPRLSPAATAFRAAIINGQRAARYQRLGRDGEAFDAWKQSEQWHRTAGDEGRARQAEAIARQQTATSTRLNRARQQPVITDHLDISRREQGT